MDKAKRLYRYVDECFTIDVMCSIFWENYEFTNQSFFYNELLDKYEIFEKLLSESVSSEHFSNKISSIRNAMDKSTREYFIYRFITYCSKIIDQKYLEGKRVNFDNATLQQQNTQYVIKKEKLVSELENELLEAQEKAGTNVVEFITNATFLLRKKEEKVFNQFN